jgi:excisionase family DNA binding protein
MANHHVTKKEAAAMLGCSTRTIERMVEAGELVAGRIRKVPNARVRFRRSDVRALLERAFSPGSRARVPARA